MSSIRYSRKIQEAVNLSIIEKHGYTSEIYRNAIQVRWPKKLRLLGSSKKVMKGEARGYLTSILYLDAGDRSKAYGGQDMCPWRSPACGPLCLGHTSGRLVMSTSQNAQAWKTLLFVHARDTFVQLLLQDIQRLVHTAQRKGLTPCVRLNGSSDIPWEKVAPELFRLYPDVQFYDYTKNRTRAWGFATHARGLPKNYHLTYSRSEVDPESIIGALLDEGVNVAIVFANHPDLYGPERFLVVDGDLTDLRFLDPPGVVVALSPKGTAAKQDTTGFVVRLPVLERA